ncbi:DUF4189 domain-containing protein [Rhizobium laguerreae]|uniref:DUF4189 domain-containing protein n=1 Tax=Rhizobium laguerreae TaxID=1076926 RepID=UPI0037041172
MRFLSLFAVLLVVLGISIGAKSLYGAVAVVPGQGLDYHGIAIGSSAREARQSALKLCGKARCKIVQQYVSGQCIHAVTGSHQIFWNNSLFSAREKNSVLKACKKADTGCKVIQSTCLPE